MYPKTVKNSPFSQIFLNFETKLEKIISWRFAEALKKLLGILLWKIKFIYIINSQEEKSGQIIITQKFYLKKNYNIFYLNQSAEGEKR